MKYLRILLLCVLMVVYFYLSEQVLASTKVELNIFSFKYGNIFLKLLLFIFFMVLLPVIFKKKTYIVIIAALSAMNIYLIIQLFSYGNII